MSTQAQRLAAIKAKLEGVSGIGKVHDYERFATREKDFADLYKDVATSRIKGWNIVRTSASRRDLSIGELRVIETWRITGFMSLDDADATGKLFDALIEDIVTAFHADRTLGNTVDDIKNGDDEFGEAGIQIDAVEPVMFAGVLCHRASLRLITDSTEANI